MKKIIYFFLSTLMVTQEKTFKLGKKKTESFFPKCKNINLKVTASPRQIGFQGWGAGGGNQCFVKRKNGKCSNYSRGGRNSQAFSMYPKHKYIKPDKCSRRLQSAQEASATECCRQESSDSPHGALQS